MPGVDQLDRLRLGIEDEVGQGGEARRPEIEHQAVDPPQDVGGRHAVDGVAAQGGAKLAHHRGRLEAVTDDVPDRHRHPPTADREGVVPVAAEALPAGRQVAARDLEPGGSEGSREIHAEYLALKRLGEPALLGEARLLDRDRGAVGGELEQVPLVGGELPRLEAADVQDAEDPVLDQQGHPEQGADSLLAQDRVEDVRVVHVVDRDRPSLRRDAPGEAAAERDLHPALDLLLDPARGARPQHPRFLVQQQDRGRVGVEDLGDPDEQLGQQVLLGQAAQSGVRDALQRLEHLAVRGRVLRPRGSGPGVHGRIISSPRPVQTRWIPSAIR